MSERTIFLAALEIEDPVRRAEYIDGACGADAGLHQRIHDLLLAHAKVGGFLEQPAVGPETETEEAIAAPTAAEALGTQIGPYKLLQKLGEGGMGAVFMAGQEAPVRRRVCSRSSRRAWTRACQCPLRTRAASIGSDGPSEHRQGF